MLSIEGVYCIGFVLGGLSLLLFLMGHLGLFTPPYLLLASLFAFSMAVIYLKRISISSGAHSVSQPLSTLERALSFFIIAFAVSVLPFILVPPSVRDELIQHLAVPKLYLLRGRIFEIPFMGFSYFPQNIDLLYIIPLAFGNDVIPRLLHLFFAVLTGLLIYFYMLPFTGRAHALTGMLLYISTPLVLNLSRTAYIDLGSAFYATLSLVGALLWKENGTRKWLVFSAIAAGLALGSKYNNLITLFLITAFIMYVSNKKGFSEVFKNSILFLSVALIVLSPWLVRNYVWRGSPFYPLYETVASTASKGEGIHVHHMDPLLERQLLYNESLFKILLTPLRIFLEGKDNSIEKFDGVLNPFFLFFLPFAFLRRGNKDNLKYLAIYSALFFLMAFFTVELVVRYLLPALPAFIIIVAFGVRNSLENKKLKLFAAIFAALLLVFNAVYIYGLYKRCMPLQYLTGRETREAYLSRNSPDYMAVSFANANLPTNSKVMFFFTGDRGYNWNREYYYGDRMGTGLRVFLRDSSSAGDLRDKFLEMGVTHLFINDRLFVKFVNDNFSKDEMAILSEFFNDHAARLYSANGFSIYEIKQKGLSLE